MLESSFILLRDIGRLPLNAQEEVHFSIDAYRGYRYVSVRRHIKTDGFSGPTRDGVTLTPEIVRALVPMLLALPQDPKQVKLGQIGKFAKRPGICVVVGVAEFRGERGLEMRNWSQEKGFSKNNIWLPLAKWAEIRELFQNTLAAVDEVPEVDF
ncbi:MAG: hypothetical protein IJ266_00960 [Elusimicrobiaceae bacterium]|nr:hypothetical protein [Elusimicrobiaceae bacterium]